MNMHYQKHGISIKVRFDNNLNDPYKRKLEYKIKNTSAIVMTDLTLKFICLHETCTKNNLIAFEAVSLEPRKSLSGYGYIPYEYYAVMPNIIFNLEGKLFSHSFDKVTSSDSDWCATQDKSEFQSVIDTIEEAKSRHVLVLGKDTEPEIQLLLNIKSNLEDNYYTGILLKEFNDIPEQTTEEKLIMCSSAVSFVIIEDTVPSGHIDEIRILASNRTVMAILHAEGMGSSWMQADYGIYYKFIRKFPYADANFTEILTQAIEWAEECVASRREQLNNLYPWR